MDVLYYPDFSSWKAWVLWMEISFCWWKCKLFLTNFLSKFHQQNPGHACSLTCGENPYHLLFMKLRLFWGKRIKLKPVQMKFCYIFRFKQFFWIEHRIYPIITQQWASSHDYEFASTLGVQIAHFWTMFCISMVHLVYCELTVTTKFVHV
jgi:hypothetical protein